MTKPKVNVTQAALDNYIQQWDPAERAVHCSNCSRCLVTGDGIKPPKTYCRAGYGPAFVDIWAMIRPANPRGFRAASKCPDFDSMDGDPPAKAAEAPAA